MPGGKVSRKHHVSKSARKGTRRKLPIPWIVAGIVVLAAAAAVILWPRPSLAAEATAAEAYAKYKAGALVLDVRSQEEWNQSHIADSMLIPLDELQNRLNEVPRDQDIVVVCKSGVRSREGANMLVRAGFTRVSCLTGGLQAWVEAGYPVEGTQ